MSIWLDLFLGGLLAFSAVAIVRSRNLVTIVVLLSVFSGFLALLFAELGALDVAFTEAVVGTGVSTVFLVALLRRVDTAEVTDRPRGRRLLAVAVCCGLGAALCYAVLALPPFGAADSPAALANAPYYSRNAISDMETPNVVTAVLGDYRGLDTMIESAVVLTAALACLLVSRRTR